MRGGVIHATPGRSARRSPGGLEIDAQPVAPTAAPAGPRADDDTHPARDARPPDRKGPHMYGISSDDRLWMIERDHAEREAHAADQRMASAAPRERSSVARDARKAGNAGNAGAHRSAHLSWITPTHLLHAFTGLRGAARHGAAR
jgi:hypothetical protein